MDFFLERDFLEHALDREQVVEILGTDHKRVTERLLEPNRVELFPPEGLFAVARLLFAGLATVDEVLDDLVAEHVHEHGRLAVVAEHSPPFFF